MGDSADVVPALLIEYAAAKAFTFFLDGRYSSGITGAGEKPVPIVREFDALRCFALANPDEELSIIVDDVRLFMPGGDAVYPERASLIAFAESISSHWRIENDLFICRRPSAK